MTKEQIKEWTDYLVDLAQYQANLISWLWWKQSTATNDSDNDEGSNPTTPPTPPKPPGS